MGLISYTYMALRYGVFKESDIKSLFQYASLHQICKGVEIGGAPLVLVQGAPGRQRWLVGRQVDIRLAASSSTSALVTDQHSLRQDRKDPPPLLVITNH